MVTLKGTSSLFWRGRAISEVRSDLFAKSLQSGRLAVAPTFMQVHTLLLYIRYGSD
jgi:hypothetical protein